MRWLPIAAALLAACSSDDASPPDSPSPAEDARAVAKTPPPPPPDASPPDARPLTLEERIAAARAKADELGLEADEDDGPSATLYEVAHDYHREIETGDVWLKFNVALHHGYRRCYQRLLRRADGKPAGRVTVSMKVLPGGRVTDVDVTESFDDRIDACLERRTRSWKFGVLADDGGARLALTVGFSP